MSEELRSLKLPRYLQKAIQDHRERVAVAQMGFNDTIAIVVGYVAEELGIPESDVNDLFTFDPQTGVFSEKPKSGLPNIEEKES